MMRWCEARVHYTHDAQAAIISKPQKPELCEILAQLLEWFAARGYECVLDPESAGYLDRRQRGGGAAGDAGAATPRSA